MTDHIARHTGQIPIYDALKLLNTGGMEDVPIPEGLTREEVVRGIQLDEYMGRGKRGMGDASEHSVPKTMGQCCAKLCLRDGYRSELGEDQLNSVLSMCAGMVFAGIEYDPSRKNVARVVTSCPSTVPDEMLPLGHRDIAGRFFTPQQVPDSKVAAIVDALTPRVYEDVIDIAKIILKNFKPRDPVETYSHADCFTYKTPWSRGVGRSLQELVFRLDARARKELGDDYSTNRAAEYIAEILLDRITKPRTRYTATDLAIGLGHLVAGYGIARQQPLEV